MSARLLIRLESCDFTANQLQQYRRMNLISEHAESEAKERIKMIDRNEAGSSHLMLLLGNIENLELFSQELGYDFIVLKGSFETACQILDDKIRTIPRTEADLPHTNPKIVGKFYDLFRRVDKVFKQNMIFYWATSGTLLGAVRHKGMIPWDDDLDVAMFKRDEHLLTESRRQLADEGLELYYRERGDFYKIFFSTGLPIKKPDGGYYPWKYPFMDVFLYAEKEGQIIYALERLQKAFPQDALNPEELESPLPELPFGPFSIPVSRNSRQLIARMYGEDWNTVAYVEYNHETETAIKRVKVGLLNASPPEYILPK